MKKTFLIAIGLIIFDQLIKNIMVFLLEMGQSILVIKNFFSLTLLGNKGAAFSILSSNTLLLILISIAVLNVIYFCLIKNKKLKNIEEISYGILIGGITGNLIDRVIRGEVIDYLDFNIFGYNFPVFNFADICIIVSIILIFIDTIKGDKNEVSSNTK